MKVLMKNPMTYASAALLLAAVLMPLPAFAADAPAPLRVALFDDTGSFGKGVPRATEIFGKREGFKLTVLKADQVRASTLKDFDVVLFTGGSGSKQAEAIGETGRADVKQFVQNGGGYVGICAGAYLACDGFSWGVKVLDAKTVSSKWRRGVGTAKIELTEEGKKILGDHPGLLSVRYANGPIIKAAQNETLPDFKPLALFRTELAENDSPKGVMINSPASAAADCGKGRVIIFSPHPEQSEGLEDLVVHAVEWVGKMKK
jgi:putative intracellular protease/amidase